MPIYKVVHAVKDPATGVGDREVYETRLIEAANTAAAMRYAVKDWITVEICTTAEAVELGASGLKIEKGES